MTDTYENNVGGAAGLERSLRSRWRIVFFLFGLAFLHGLVVNLMPVMFRTIGKTFDVDKAAQGLLVSTFMLGSVAGLIVAGYLTVYMGVKRISVLGCIVAGAGSFLFGLSKTYVLTLISAGIISLGISPVIPCYAAIIAANFEDIRQRMYMWSYAVFAGSATIATAVLGVLLDELPSYSIIFVSIGLFFWLWIAILLIVARESVDGKARKSQALHGADSPKTTFHEKLAALRLLSSGIFATGSLYLLAILIICDYASETNKGAWLPTLFSETYKSTAWLGGMALSASSAGVCLGRILMGALPPGKIPDRILLGCTYLINVISFTLLLALKPDCMTALTLIFLCGASISAQAPTMGSLAIAKFGKRAPIVTPMVEAVGNFCGLIGPPLVGLVAMEVGGLSEALWFIPVAGLMLSMTAFLWEIYDRKHGINDKTSNPSTE